MNCTLSCQFTSCQIKSNRIRFILISLIIYFLSLNLTIPTLPSSHIFYHLHFVPTITIEGVQKQWNWLPFHIRWGEFSWNLIWRCMKWNDEEWIGVTRCYDRKYMIWNGTIWGDRRYDMIWYEFIGHDTRWHGMSWDDTTWDGRSGAITIQTFFHCKSNTSREELAHTTQRDWLTDGRM